MRDIFHSPLVIATEAGAIARFSCHSDRSATIASVVEEPAVPPLTQISDVRLLIESPFPTPQSVGNQQSAIKNQKNDESLVPSKGLEPPHPCEYMDLNHARLPIPPRWQVDFSSRRPEGRRFRKDLRSYFTGTNLSVKRAPFPQWTSVLPVMNASVLAPTRVWQSL